jgi:hypothetical protein
MPARLVILFYATHYIRYKQVPIKLRTADFYITRTDFAAGGGMQPCAGNYKMHFILAFIYNSVTWRPIAK